jgi:uncharacterized membrane protein YfcA
VGELSVGVLALLALIGLVGGVGITAVGPGGVLPTIGLFALTDLSPAMVAGTAIVTHIATGALGTVAYTRSGELRNAETRRTALILAGTALVSTPVGVVINASVSKHVFGVVLGVFAAVVAGLLWVRERHTGGQDVAHPPTGRVVAVGLCVGVAAGVIGIGGPMLTVPVLIVLRVPVLESLAAAQVQSIVIATVGTVGYAVHGSIDWELAAVVGLPELAGVFLGWQIARAVPARALKMALIGTLIVLAPYLALHG